MRIFANDETIKVYEVPRPYETTLIDNWTADNSGGARAKEEDLETGLKVYKPGKDKEKQYKFSVNENPLWPLNPQYLIEFDSSVSMKVILKKTEGLSIFEKSKIGMIITKPEQPDTLNYEKKKKLGGAHANKQDIIKRILDSTRKLLDSKPISKDEINRKLSLNPIEWAVETEYSSEYVASTFINFNKIDNPVIIVPTMERAEDLFNYNLTIYSNKPVTVTPLSNEYTKILTDSWNDTNCFGNHLLHKDKKRSSDVEKPTLDENKWLENPKFRIFFDSREKIPIVEFEIYISRMESCWQDKIAKGIVNTMVGVYLFDYDKENWQSKIIDKDHVKFEPKLDIKLSYKKDKVDPRGFIIMPTTYTPFVKGPFSIMVKCKEKFYLEKFEG